MSVHSPPSHTEVKANISTFRHALLFWPHDCHILTMTGTVEAFRATH